MFCNITVNPGCPTACRFCFVQTFLGQTSPSCFPNGCKGVFYLRFIWQNRNVDLSQGLHGFGGSGFGQQSKQGVWDGCWFNTRKKHFRYQFGGESPTLLRSRVLTVWVLCRIVTHTMHDIQCNVAQSWHKRPRLQHRHCSPWCFQGLSQHPLSANIFSILWIKHLRMKCFPTS